MFLSSVALCLTASRLLLLSSLSSHVVVAIQPFAESFELQAGVDILLSQNDTNAVKQVEETYGPIEEWDVSQITHFQNLFNARTRNSLAASANFDLSKWNVSNARYLQDMFLGAANMDFDVSTWNTSSALQFNGMWEGASSFQGRGLEKWNVQSGTLFMVMFADTKSLASNLDLRSWNVQKAVSLTAMFRNANFGGGDANAPSARNEATYNLCDWALKLPVTAETDGMFMGTQCPDSRDPQLVAARSGSGLVSFCVPCGGSLRPPPQPDNPGLPSQQSSADRPNILFIMADQMRFDTIRSVQDSLTHYDGHFKIDTPHLDKLLQQGAYFETAYCQCAVCAPARTTLRTGCTIERTGIQHNDLIHEHEYTNGEVFRRRVENLEGIDHILVDKLGYVSEYYGKWHMPEHLATSHVTGQSILQHNDYDYDSDTFYYQYDSSSRKLGRYLDYFEELGRIDRDLSEKGMQIDTYTKFPYTPVRLDSRWNMTPGTDLNGDQFESWEQRESNVMGPYKLSEKYTPSHFEGTIAVKALNRLKEQRRREGKAWFLTASFHNPHPPMVPAWSHLRKYWDSRPQLYVPISLNDTLDNTPYKAIKSVSPKYGEPANVQEWTAVYYALIEEIDEYVGLLLEELGNDIYNTLVVFTSDHGEMLGAHGKREKNNFYEESSRVPLLISFPGVIPSNTIIQDPVSHLDVFATILDYIGASDMDQSDGTSLRPLIDRDSDEFGREFDQGAVFAEWDFRKPNPSDVNLLDRRLDDRPSFMVRKGPYKLMMQKLADSNQMDMMFNLTEDSHERDNLLGKFAMDASTTVIEKAEHMRCLLLDWMERLDSGPTGNQAYFSDPASNYFEGDGDINEIRKRQKWKQIGLWTSSGLNDPLSFGPVVWTGSEFIRHEWLYLGTRQNDTYTIESAEITGRGSIFFSFDEFSILGTKIDQNSCKSIRITFRANIWSSGASMEATLILKLTKDDGSISTRSVPLMLEDTTFVSRRAPEKSEDKERQGSSRAPEKSEEILKEEGQESSEKSEILKEERQESSNHDSQLGRDCYSTKDSVVVSGSQDGNGCGIAMATLIATLLSVLRTEL